MKSTWCNLAFWVPFEKEFVVETSLWVLIIPKWKGIYVM